MIQGGDTRTGGEKKGDVVRRTPKGRVETRKGHDKGDGPHVGDGGVVGGWSRSDRGESGSLGRVGDGRHLPKGNNSRGGVPRVE